MGYSLNAVQAEAVLQALKQNYSVYAPKRFPKQGRYSDTDVIRYAEVEHYEDIVWQVKSDYPAKEVLTPIQQAIFYFTEDEYRASKGPKKPILILIICGLPRWMWEKMNPSKLCVVLKTSTRVTTLSSPKLARCFLGISKLKSQSFVALCLWV